ncbi:alpha/beta hydrolase [Amycolatopsis thermalba]|uniref:Alpha/beta hydrolase n=1 Tax=Amycolatopsis thermalba TaxID=944492 RepID=A0ABY4NZU8_9PSEU|nr:alpha/beta hydrolase [Amycolatopsis thermalba]
MTTFVLVPGAGGQAWYWHRLVPELTRRGHEAIAVDLPAEDDSAGLPEYTDVVVRAIGDRRNVVLVAQSMGGFTAPLVCERVPVSLLVLLNAMVPAPGETGGQWWAGTGYDQAHPEEMDVERDFLHDLPPDVRAEAIRQGEPAAVRHTVHHPLATGEVAGRADPVRPGSRRPVLPAGVPAPGGAGAAGPGAGRDPGRAPGRAQSSP